MDNFLAAITLGMIFIICIIIAIIKNKRKRDIKNYYENVYGSSKYDETLEYRATSVSHSTLDVGTITSDELVVKKFEEKKTLKSALTFSADYNTKKNNDRVVEGTTLYKYSESENIWICPFCDVENSNASVMCCMCNSKR